MKNTAIVTMVLALTLSTMAHAAEKIQKIPVLGTANFIEGIAYSKKLKKFFVGSAEGGSLQEVTADGKVKWIQENGTDNRHKSLGIKVDDERNRLWVVGNDAVYIYELPGLKLLKKNSVAELGNYASTFLNDLALDAEGSAYITDSFSPHLFKVDGKDLTISVFAKLKDVPYGTINKSPWNLNGVVMTPDQKALLLAKTNDGTLWRLDLKTKKVAQVKLSKPVQYVDGMVWGASGTLYMIRNFENTISKIEYDAKAGSQKVQDLPIDKNHFLIPTTAAFVEEENALVVVNSQFEQAPKEFFLTQIKL